MSDNGLTWNKSKGPNASLIRSQAYEYGVNNETLIKTTILEKRDPILFQIGTTSGGIRIFVYERMILQNVILCIDKEDMYDINMIYTKNQCCIPDKDVEDINHILTLYMTASKEVNKVIDELCKILKEGNIISKIVKDTVLVSNPELTGSITNLSMNKALLHVPIIKILAHQADEEKDILSLYSIEPETRVKLSLYLLNLRNKIISFYEK